jgi:hypothetical protein
VPVIERPRIITSKHNWIIRNTDIMFPYSFAILWTVQSLTIAELMYSEQNNLSRIRGSQVSKKERKNNKNFRTKPDEKT